MCGIGGIISFKAASGSDVLQLNQDIRHRGPDDEGYLTWHPGQPPMLWAGAETAAASRGAHQLAPMPPDISFSVGLCHRRLSILDLSPAGFQPMVLPDAGLAVVFNGEIYNYIEVREELKRQGIQFRTNSDTEVLLQAWAAWGADCMHRFNGMFAFLLLDYGRQKLFAVRDRFGVKPLYYHHAADYIAFASEVKQLRRLTRDAFRLNAHIALDYLKYGFIDHDPDTFEQDIRQLMPGHLMEWDLQARKQVIKAWYQLKPRPWKGSEADARRQFQELLYSAVQLRMRSDVPVGSALSGGLDSSTVVCLMRKALTEGGNNSLTLETVTSASTDKRFDESSYAHLVNEATGSISHKVFPDFDKLLADFDRLLWHMDYPFGSTSQFSQWCVFERARQAGLIVMIDGQGADEQLAGYGGNDLSLYAGLLSGGRLAALWQESASYRSRQGHWPKGFWIGALAQLLPAPMRQMLPAAFRTDTAAGPSWLARPHMAKSNLSDASLQQHLIGQVQIAPLPALLRYEDRNSMAFSVESRTPFMDYRLMEFTLGLPEEFVYRQGERKYILRQAFRGIVPDAVLDRKDKMGFVSPEERWLKEDGKAWFEKMVEHGAIRLEHFVDRPKAQRMMHLMQEGREAFSFEPWRILCLGAWLNSMGQGR